MNLSQSINLKINCIFTRLNLEVIGALDWESSLLDGILGVICVK